MSSHNFSIKMSTFGNQRFQSCTPDSFTPCKTLQRSNWSYFQGLDILWDITWKKTPANIHRKYKAVFLLQNICEMKIKNIITYVIIFCL